MAGEVKIAIVGDAASLRRVLSEVSDDLDKQGKRTEDVGRKMQVAGAVSMAAGGLMYSAMSTAANTASDLNEAINQTEVIFGAASDSVSDFAENSVSIGMSERAARDATGQFGLLFKNVGQTAEASAGMSVELTKLAADAASFKNTSPEEAVQAFGSALRGESEPIRAYGVMLDEAAVKNKAMELGLVSAGGELDNAAKVQARYALILEQSSAFAGDFTNTSDSLANQQRITAAETENATAKMGAGFVPVMEKAQSVMRGAVGVFGDLDEKTGGFASTAAVATAGTLAVGGALTTVVGTAVRMSESFGQVTNTLSNVRDRFSQVGEDGSRSMTKLGTAVTAVGGIMAAAGIVAGLVAMSQEVGKLEVNVDAFSKSSTESLTTVFVDLIEGEGRYKKFGLSATAVFKEVADGSVGTAQRIRDALAAAGQDTTEFDRILAASVEQHKQLEKDATASAEAIKAGTPATRAAGDAAANAAAGNYALGSSYRFAGDAAYDAYNSTWSYAGALDKAYDAAFASTNAADDFARATDFSTKATKSGGGAMRDAAKDAERLEDAQRGVTEAEAELADAVLKRFLVQLGPSQNQIAIAEIEARQRKRALAQATDEVREAEEALIKAQKSNDGAAIAAAVAAQERALAEAKRNVERAELRVVEAQERLTKARADGDPTKITQAELDLADAQDDVKDATDKSKAASDGLSTAQELQEAAARDTEKASRDLEAAHDDVTLAEIEAKQAETELTDTRNIGTAGSKELKAANDEVEAANRRVSEATRALRDAETEMSSARGGGGGSIETTKSLSEQLQIVEERGRAWIKSLQDHGAPASEVDAALDTIRARMQEISDREPGHEEILQRYWSTFEQNAGNARDTLQQVFDKMNEIQILLAMDPTLVGNLGNSSSRVPGSHSGSVVGVDSPEMFDRPRGPQADERLRLLKKGQMVLTQGQQKALAGMIGSGDGGGSSEPAAGGGINFYMTNNFPGVRTRDDATYVSDAVQRALMSNQMRVALAGA